MLKGDLVHETLDGETIIIDLSSGSYYSLEGSAADLWARLVACESIAESAESLSVQHSGDFTALRGRIADFHRQLFDHGLVISQPPAESAPDGDLGSFELPKIRVYDDLREHLLLDPIHDVERGAGWPVPGTGT